jgi:DNA invertase Pin-like site-specific DNA recombinase
VSALDGIAAAQRQRDARQAELRQAVLDARAEGFRWWQIAKVFGVTRQAVTRRFGE